MAATASSMRGDRAKAGLHTLRGVVRGFPTAVLVGFVKFYQWFLSPLKVALFGAGARCRFEPSCSCYAVEALRAHGFFYGSWLTARRLSKCHPWGPWGADPVPKRRERKSEAAAKADGSCGGSEGLIALNRPLRTAAPTLRK